MRKDRFGFKGIKVLDDIHEIEKTPLDQQDIPQSTYEGFKSSVEIYGKDTALSFFMLGDDYKSSFDYTYNEIFKSVNKIANMLNSLGVGEKDVVALILPNLPETAFSYLAAQCTGIVMPINPLLEPEIWKELLLEANAKVLITVGPFLRTRTDIWEKVNSIRKELPNLKSILYVDLSRYLHGAKKVLVNLIMTFKRTPRPDAYQDIINLHSFMKDYSGRELRFKRDIKPSDIATYFHTGGTTGTPKIASHSHANICFNGWSTGNNMDTSEENLTIFGGLPLFHVFGAMATTIIPFSGGGKVIMATPRGFRGEGVLENFWKIIDHYKINYIAAVPAIFKKLSEVPIGNADISTVKMAISGSAPMPVDFFRKFEKETDIKIIEGYGCTEGTCICSVNPLYGERKIGSTGYRIPYQRVKIFKLSETGKEILECEANEVGMVCIEGPNVFKGYVREEHNKDIWIDHKNERWYNTGDLGRLDPDGYLWLTGRKKELIIRGGHNIDPGMIEEPMHDHPAVAFAAAVGRPDKDVGEVPVLYIELNKGQSIDEKALLEYAKSSIPERAAIPKAVYFLDELPRTTMEKIYKPALLEKEIIRVYREELKDVSGLNSIDISVRSDRKYGTTANVKAELSDGNNSEQSRIAIEEKLAPFSVHYELEIY